MGLEPLPVNWLWASARVGDSNLTGGSGLSFEDIWVFFILIP